MKWNKILPCCGQAYILIYIFCFINLKFVIFMKPHSPGIYMAVTQVNPYLWITVNKHKTRVWFFDGKKWKHIR